jgi:hypothetical protein
VAAQSWAQECDRPHDNHHGSLRAAIVASGVAGLLIVVLRIFSRAYTLRRFWWDDWSHIIAGVCFDVTKNIRCDAYSHYGIGAYDTIACLQ